MSDDLLNQHAAISEIQQAEEIVVDQHKAINEFLSQLLPESIELYNMTNNVDYDQDGNNLDNFLTFFFIACFIQCLCKTIYSCSFYLQLIVNVVKKFSLSWLIWRQRVKI